MEMDQEKAECIFFEALKRVDPEERSAYLDSECGTDTPMRAEIDSLLEAYENKAGVLKAPTDLLDSPVNALTEGPGSIIGSYKLLELIGEGGFGAVYMAEQQEPIRRKVALKIIKLGMDTKQVIGRFEAERQALAMMNHPSIAKVFDAGATETGRPYFVMELVRGVSITEYCDKNTLNTGERMDLFIQVCGAVQHAHQKGIIHRDIKPTNILVTLHEGKPLPTVIDFGIAKATSQRLTEKTFFTRYAQMIGTPEYMSPEQAEMSKLDVDTRADIYSLGVLLYELLTGTLPFEPEQLREAGYIEIQRIICEKEPDKPSTKLSTMGEALAGIARCRKTHAEALTKLIRGDLDWIVMKSLEKDPNRRYETASELAMDIRRHLGDQPVQAGPPGAGYRLRKFVRRKRVAVMTVTLIVGATLMGATAVKLGLLVSPGSLGRPQHAAGMGQRHIWDVPAESSLCGGISRDGRYLSYTDWTAGNLAVCDLTTKTSWLVTKNTDSTWETIDGWADKSAVSPDGTQIAYSWCNEKGLNFYDLRITDLDGSNIRVLYGNPAIFYICPYAWSPDGKEILACLGDKNKSPVEGQSDQLYKKSHLVLVSIADGSVRTLKTWHKESFSRSAFFSPDGNHILFDFEQQDNPGRYDIHQIGRDGEDEIALISHPADDRLLGWAPDGRTIIFTSDRTAGRGLWKLDVIDGEPQRPAELLIDEFNGGELGFTADGSYYYVVDTTASNVCLATADPNVTALEDQPWIASSKFVGHAVLGEFSRDGRFITYRVGVRHKVGAGDWVFVVNSLDTGRERVLTPEPAFHPNRKIWDGPWFYPDGKALLVLAYGMEAGYGLYKIDIETGVTTPIHAPCEKIVRSAAWSPDGSSIYIRTDYQIIKLEPTTGRQTTLYEGPYGPYEFDVSADGQWLAFYPEPDVLSVMPSSGGEPREIVHENAGEITTPNTFVKWTRDGRELLFGKRKNEFWKVSVERGEQHQIAVMDMELMDVAVHPDGRGIALTTHEAGSQLWVTENFLPEQQK